MRCEQCGANLTDESLFCYACGNRFDKKIDNKKNPSEQAGVTYGNVSNASTIYGETKFNAARGHGFAAERANHLYDKVTGNDAQLVGDDNAKNGADRIVNGVQIQSKYCATGSKCIKECFDKNGNWRYSNPDGSPMKIEVPSDKYDDAVRAMEERIRRGEVPGVSDPAKAKEIVCKGHFTYEQAKNIARFGTVESITYDAVNGAIVGATTFGITAAMTFAVSVWNGEKFDDALHNAVAAGVKVGGISFATAVLAGQMTKAGAYGLAADASAQIVKLMGPKAAAVLVNAFRSGTNIYGAAAMKSAQKMLGSNMVTAVASVVVLSTVDVVNVFRGRISGAQLFKNVINTSASIAGGATGWTAGAAAGAAVGSVIPGVGNAIGAVVGGILGAACGGSVAGKAATAVTDEFIEDDANEMVRIIESEFANLANDYLLNQTEAEKVVDGLSKSIDGSTLKDMYAESNRERFARDLIKPHIEAIVKNREIIRLPDNMQMVQGLRFILEENS